VQLPLEAVAVGHNLLLRKRRWKSVAETAWRLETLRTDRVFAGVTAADMIAIYDQETDD